MLKRGTLAPVKRLARVLRGRFLAWSERTVQTQWNGLTLFFPSRSEIGQLVHAGDGWDANLAPISRALFSQGAGVVAEVGSNIGASLLQMKSAVPTLRVYCFEPVPRFASCLERTVEANAWADVTVERWAVSREDGTLDLFSNTSTASAARPTYGGHTFLKKSVVPSITLDRYFAQRERVGLVKIDTDGLDFDVLLSGAAMIAQSTPVLYFEYAPFLMNDREKTVSEGWEMLTRLGYGPSIVFAHDGAVLTRTGDINATRLAAGSQRYVDILLFPDDASAITLANRVCSELGLESRGKLKHGGP
jgi:FkbM family methyltransferase